MDAVKRNDFIAATLSTSTECCVLWPYAVRKSSGYGAYSRKIAGRVENWDAHRFVCVSAHGQPAPRQEAAHSCGNKLCVNPAHLSWASHAENMGDAKRHGRLRGGGRYRQRFFADDVAAIRASGESYSALADRYGTDVAYIGRIRRAA